jgi:hypothetical protein
MSKLLKEAVDLVMNDAKAPAIHDDYRRQVTEAVIENQIKYNQGMNESDTPANQTSGVANFDPILIKMVRRSMPKLMAFDLAGVQPMTGPTGSIFAMRARYSSQTGTEALFDEANTAFSGAGTQAGDTSGFAVDAFGTDDPEVATATGTGMSTANAQLLGTDSGDAWNEMAFSIERTDVSVKSRKLKAQFSRELAYDLKNIHNMDAETELANILSTEITAEIDREILRTINVAAVLGAQSAAVPGLFNLAADSDGRWLVEKFKGLLFQIELEANRVSIETRRGRANRIICSSNVASALNMAGVLDYNNPGIASNMTVDPTAGTYSGVLMGKYQVYIDPYAGRDYVTVGYKGANAWDAGIFYCPYLPLEMYRAVGEDSFAPKIGFASRYGIIANPYEHNDASGARAGKGLGQGENRYYRKFAVSNLTG